MADEQTPQQRARSLGLRALASHMRTERQLRARLERAGLGEEAEAAIGWLRALGYLDDGAYAAARARSLVAEGRLGPRLAERRLAGEGIAPAAARAAVAAALGDAPGGELARCRALAARRLRGAEPGSLEPRARARLARWLLGRGFAGEVVARVLGGFEDRELEGGEGEG